MDLKRINVGKINFRLDFSYLGHVLILTAVYVITAWLGFSFAFLEKKITLAWPPTGIALAAILLFGYRLWPALALGSIIATILAGAPLTFTIVLAFSIPIGAVTGAYLIQRWTEFHIGLNRAKDVLALIFPGAVFTALISSALGIFTLCLIGSMAWQKCSGTWMRWFIGDLLGIILVTPALLTWATPVPQSKNPKKMLEAGALTMLVVISSLSVYGGWLERMMTYPFSYIIFPLAIWAALRFGTRAVSLIIVYWTTAAVWGTLKGLGPFIHSSLPEDLIHLDLTLALLVPLLILAAVISEQKQAQLALLESEERYRLLVEHSPDAIFVHTGNRITFVNSAGLQLLGATSCEQLIDKQPLDFLHPDYTGPILEQMQQLLVEKKPVPINEEKFIRFDGVTIDVEVASIPITYRGKPAIQMVTRDITARKRSEEELRISEARFRELSEAAEEGLAIHHYGTILEANEALARMFGYQLQELIGMYAAKLATPETWETIKKHMAENYDKPYEGIGVRKDGSTFWCQMVGKQYNHHGKLLRLAVFRDISEQKKAQEAQKIFERKYRRLFEFAKDGLIIIDDETLQIIDVNPFLEKMFEFNHGELTGKKFTEIEQFKNIEICRKGLKIPDYKDFIHYEHLPLKNTRGIQIDVEFICNSFEDNGHGIIVCNVRDITTRKQAEEKMRQAQTVIARANEMKNIFLTNISHEIRTPMNSILGFAQLLDELIVQKQSLDKEKGMKEERRLEENVRENLQREYIASIKSCSEVLINLLNDILDLKKIEAGKLNLQYEFVTPQAIFSEMKQIFMPKIREKKLEFIVKIDHDLPNTIFIDKLRLQQILFNLINNALKFTLHGFIKLELQKACRDDNPDICDLIFSVQDTGIGIAKDQLENIFEAFSQKKGQNTNFGGTGLGLTISRNLAQMMNGTIQVESVEGQGSIFKVILKDVKVGTGLEITDVQVQENLDTRKFDNTTILIADDNPTNRALKRHFFNSSLAHFIEAANGREAIELTRKYKPDLIIMNLKMPIMNGTKAARIIKEDKELKDIPIIADAYSGSLDTVQEMIQMGFDGALQGSYDRSQLLKELLRFLPRIIEKQLQDKKNLSNNKVIYSLGNIPAPMTPKIHELIAILKNELTLPWNHIRDTFILDEINMFVQRILKLGEIYDVQVLTQWGNDIKDLTASCDMENLMTTLDYFPSLIKQLEDYLKNQEEKNGQ